MFVSPNCNLHSPYTGRDILTVTVPICILFIITFLTAGVAGSTKKFAFGCVYQLGYAVGNIIGPQTYRADDAPNYYVRTSSLLRLNCVNIISFPDGKIYYACIFRCHCGFDRNLRLDPSHLEPEERERNFHSATR